MSPEGANQPRQSDTTPTGSADGRGRGQQQPAQQDNPAAPSPCCSAARDPCPATTPVPPSLQRLVEACGRTSAPRARSLWLIDIPPHLLTACIPLQRLVEACSVKPEDIHAALCRQNVDIVFTAHPTQARSLAARTLRGRRCRSPQTCSHAVPPVADSGSTELLLHRPRAWAPRCRPRTVRCLCAAGHAPEPAEGLSLRDVMLPPVCATIVHLRLSDT